MDGKTDYSYDTRFFDYVDIGAASSARRALQVLLEVLGEPPGSVADFGCGRGHWAGAMSELSPGTDVLGVDGDYVDRDNLVIPPECFVAQDLTRPFPPRGQFDLALCLEVGEHLPAEAAPVLVDTLVAHAPMVLFSAAVPGQGGEHHVNEQPLEYWRGHFAAHGFDPHDCLRPRILKDRLIEPWYRYNSLLYVSRERADTLAPGLRATRVPPEEKITDVAPAFWRLRCAAIGVLPSGAVGWLARAKHAAVRSLNNRKRQ